MPQAIQQKYIAQLNTEVKYSKLECGEATSDHAADHFKDNFLGVWKYPIEALLTKGHNNQNVNRRYTEIETLHKLFKMYYPGCIIPKIPTKLLNHSAEAMTKRRLGIQNFFDLVRLHDILGNSKLFEIFMTRPELFTCEAIVPLI